MEEVQLGEDLLGYIPGPDFERLIRGERTDPSLLSDYVTTLLRRSPRAFVRLLVLTRRPGRNILHQFLLGSRDAARGSPPNPRWRRDSRMRGYATGYALVSVPTEDGPAREDLEPVVWWRTWGLFRRLTRRMREMDEALRWWYRPFTPSTEGSSEGDMTPSSVPTFHVDDDDDRDATPELVRPDPGRRSPSPSPL